MRSVEAMGAVGVGTLVCAYVPHLNPTTVGFLYLVTTLVIATKWGLVEAVVASVVATVCYNFFFLPPLYTFRIAEPQNWVALFTFLLAALLTSQLSERAKRRAAEALSRQQDLEQLHAVSRAILLSEASGSLAKELASEIARVYGAASVAIYDRTTGETFCAGPEDPSGEVEWKLRDSALHGGTFRDEKGHTLVTAFGVERKPAGSLALTGTSVSDAALESLSNLVAIGLEKARHQEAANRAEAARQTEEFKSTLLDALAHEFKTPLTTIKAAASAMLPAGVPEAEQQREFSMIIEQEADRLTRLVTEAIHLARIEAGKMRLEKQPCEVPALIESAVRQMETILGARAVEVSVAEELPMVLVDRELMQLVLRQLLDNAVKYSATHSPIRIRAGLSSQFVRISVWNDGPPVPQWEKTKLVEKFYRGTTAGFQSTGTGMGLAIAKEIMSAHGGDVRVESSPEQGTEVSVLVPVSAERVFA